MRYRKIGNIEKEVWKRRERKRNAEGLKKNKCRTELDRLREKRQNIEYTLSQHIL